MLVTRADQDDINRFSILSTRTLYHTDLLSLHRREIANLDEALGELDLILDEDEPVRVVCGTGFVYVPVDMAKEQLSAKIVGLKRKCEGEIEILEQLSQDMIVLKERLYAKFGDAIHLELDPNTTIASSSAA